MMKITLANVSESKALSQETPAFTAVVVVNGVKVAHARNDGRGGCCFYDVIDRERFNAVTALAEEHFGNFDPVDSLVYSLLDRRDVEREVKREMKKSIVTVHADRKRGEYYSYRYTGTLTPEALSSATTTIKQDDPDAIILNGNDGAFETFIDEDYGLKAAAKIYRHDMPAQG